jgi:hypothetical protein
MKLTYLNYKEPLKAVEEGFGFLGTLAQTKNSNEVQCHICGGVYENLGHHAWVKHGIKARDYRTQFKLGLRTPLCSDAFSERYKSMQLAAYSRMTDEQRDKKRAAMQQAQEKACRVGNPRSLEALNRDGMCPDQLIDHIKKCADKLGKSPSFKEFEVEYGGKYVGAIIRTFGSWNGAKKMANLVPCKSGSRVPHNKSEYSNELLLEFLRSFYREKGHKPSHSDWRRGYLPSYHLYRHRFGGIQKARELAGI